MGTGENPRNGKEREMTDAIIQQQRRRERKGKVAGATGRRGRKYESESGSE